MAGLSNQSPQRIEKHQGGGQSGQSGKADCAHEMGLKAARDIAVLRADLMQHIENFFIGLQAGAGGE